MGIGLRLLTSSNNLRNSLLLFLGVVVLIGMTPCTEAQIAFTSDGLLEDDVLDWEPKIYVMTTDGKDIKQLIHHNRGDWAAAWSPDGRRIAFASDRVVPVIINQPPQILERLEIYVIDVRRRKPINLTQHPADDNHPAWSPDGKQIAFASNRDRVPENWEIYVMNADGSNPTRLTNHPLRDSNPTWSPDGQQIAYSSRNFASFLYSIYIIEVNSGKRVALIENLELAVEPAWSPKLFAVFAKGKLSALWGILKTKQ